MTLADLLFVWPGPQPPTPAPDSLACTVGAWPTALGCDVVGWDTRRGPSKAQRALIRDKRVIMVNLFGDSNHVAHIRAANPHAHIIAMPDPPLEYVLRDEPVHLLRQMALADTIGGRTRADVTVYGALLGKPTVWLPSPIGPVHAFRALWTLPKRDVLIASEHNGIRAHSGATVAALALVQRELGCDVHFYRANERTRQLAELAGLQAEWRPALDYPAMCAATAQAQWGIDLYPFHAQGRTQQTHAMAGTPCAGSWTTNPIAGSLAYAPYAVQAVADRVICHWDGPEYHGIRHTMLAECEQTYGYAASATRVRRLLEEQWT